MLYWFTAKPQSGNQPTFAHLTQCDEAKRGASTLPTEIGLPLGPGHLRLDEGRATLRFELGAQVFLGTRTDLEIRDAMTAILHSGTVVVDAPESAHGFTAHTENAIAIDHGTKFAISVDRNQNSSHVQVIGGEVEVRHPISGQGTKLLKGEGVTATRLSLGEKNNESFDEIYGVHSEDGSVRPDAIRITTATGRGRDATIVKSNDQKLLDPAFVMVKNCLNNYQGEAICISGKAVWPSTSAA